MNGRDKSGENAAESESRRKRSYGKRISKATP